MQITSGFKKVLSASGLFLAAMLPPLAHAALGGPENSIAIDARELKASVKAVERPLYRLHEIQLVSGTQLRQFVAADGIVFAVAWSGPALPDLRQTLGVYFDSYVSATRAGHRSRNHVDLRQGDWVVQSSGHMRAFTGRAFLPKSIPSGVSLDEIH